MTETQRKPLTRRDALAVGATMLSAAALGTTTVPQSATARREAGSTRKVRIGVVGGGFGAAFQWYQHPNCVVTGVTDLRADRRDTLRDVYHCDQVYDSETMRSEGHASLT